MKASRQSSKQQSNQSVWSLVLLCLSAAWAVSYLYYEGNATVKLLSKCDAKTNVVARAFDASQCSAKTIVRNAYARHYRAFVNSCKADKPYKQCLVNATDESAPWWLQRLLNDPKHKFVRDYHKMIFDDPKLRVCKIERVGSNEWTQISSNYFAEQASLSGNSTDILKFGWKPETDDAPQAVFLRDPLDRFLSSYVEKCVKDGKASNCELVSPDLLTIRSAFTERQAFASFVQTFPLLWGVYFVPQALFCDGLFRTLNKYDYVINMQDNVGFMRDVFDLMRKYPGRLMDHLRQAFKINPKTTDYRAEIRQQSKLKRLDRSPVGKFPPDYLLRFYDADTVRQTLEYFAIDYVTLKLKIPDWAQDVLDRDCHQKHRSAQVAKTA
jgi:Sulfotransferase family